MRILFFPNDSGGGFGHISMSLSLAEEAKKRGNACAFVLSKRKFFTKIKCGFNVFLISEQHFYNYILNFLKGSLFLRKRFAPIFTEVSKIDFLVMRDGLTNEKRLKKRLGRYIKIVRTFHPDVLVGDTDILLGSLSLKVSIPVVQIVRQLTHPQSAKLVWWKDIPRELHPPETLGLFNSFFKKNDLPQIGRTEELLSGNLYLIPSIPKIEPIAAVENTEFVGPLLNNPSGNFRGEFDHFDKSKPLVYMTIGAGAGGVGNKSLFLTIIEAFKDMDVQLIVSTSSKFKKHEFLRLPDNIRFYRWVPGRPTIEKADLVIFHGGYATMMEVLSCGKPSIVVPFQTEQESNGRRLEQLGCGRVLKLSKAEYKEVNCKWKYGWYNYLIQTEFDLSSEDVSREVNEVLSHDTYRQNAKKVQTMLNEYSGAARALDIIEEKFFKRNRQQVFE
jgi:UDP:flavonoid glycosyltransferase YjiC (YdhE family)